MKQHNLFILNNLDIKNINKYISPIPGLWQDTLTEVNNDSNVSTIFYNFFINRLIDVYNPLGNLGDEIQIMSKAAIQHSIGFVDVPFQLKATMLNIGVEVKQLDVVTYNDIAHCTFSDDDGIFPRNAKEFSAIFYETMRNITERDNPWLFLTNMRKI